MESPLTSEVTVESLAKSVDELRKTVARVDENVKVIMKMLEASRDPPRMQSDWQNLNSKLGETPETPRFIIIKHPENNSVSDVSHSQTPKALPASSKEVKASDDGSTLEFPSVEHGTASNCESSTVKQSPTFLPSTENLQRLVQACTISSRLGTNNHGVISNVPSGAADVKNDMTLRTSVNVGRLGREGEIPILGARDTPAKRSGTPKGSGGTTMDKSGSCPYCPRQFEHNHSMTLHVRSCKKKHENTVIRQREIVNRQQNSNCIGFGYNDDSALENVHDRTVSVRRKEEKMIKCRYCERSFPTRHQVTSHERVHTGDRPYSCYICSIKFAHGGNMIKHIKSKHPNQNAYVCRACKRDFQSHLEVKNHRKTCEPPRRTSRSRSKPALQPEIGSSELILYSNDLAGRNERDRDSDETLTASEDEGNSQGSLHGQQPPARTAMCAIKMEAEPSQEPESKPYQPKPLTLPYSETVVNLDTVKKEVEFQPD